MCINARQNFGSNLHFGMELLLILFLILMVPYVVSVLQNQQGPCVQSSRSWAPTAAEIVPFINGAGPAGLEYNPVFSGGIGGSTSLGGGPSLGGGSH